MLSIRKNTKLSQPSPNAHPRKQQIRNNHQIWNFPKIGPEIALVLIHRLDSSFQKWTLSIFIFYARPFCYSGRGQESVNDLSFLYLISFGFQHLVPAPSPQQMIVSNIRNEQETHGFYLLKALAPGLEVYERVVSLPRTHCGRGPSHRLRNQLAYKGKHCQQTKQHSIERKWLYVINVGLICACLYQNQKD